MTMAATRDQIRARTAATLDALDAEASNSAPGPRLVEPAAPPLTRTVHLTRASTIKPRAVLWFWLERLALGTLALIGGREGIGKSICAYTLAADCTRGRLSGVYLGTPRAVIIVATEDSWAHTIVPRLMAAGADLTKVYRADVLTAGLGEASLSLPRDLPSLEIVIADVGAALIILDPMLSRLDAALDTHKDAEVRQALEPLVALADRARVTILGLIHVNKSASTDALTTLMGSRAFAAVARSVLFVMTDPDNEEARLLGQAKNNLGRMDLPTLSFRIIGVQVADTADGPVWTGKLEWTGQSDRTIREALDAATEAAGDKTATSEASDWLDDYLRSQDGPADSAIVKRKGAAAGHSTSALHRARHKLKVVTVTSGFPRRTFWAQSSHARGETGMNGMNETTGTTDVQSSQSFQSSATPREEGTTDGDRL
jgi:AAA domain